MTFASESEVRKKGRERERAKDANQAEQNNLNVSCGIRIIDSNNLKLMHKLDCVNE